MNIFNTAELHPANYNIEVSSVPYEVLLSVRHIVNIWLAKLSSQERIIQQKEGNMTEGGKRWSHNSPALAGVIWFIGWLFTIGFASLVWWKILLGIIIWPYFLGVALG